MPRYDVSEALQKVLGFDNQYLFALSQNTYELLNSIFEQVEWDVLTVEQRDLYRKASEEIMNMANVADILVYFEQFVERMTCICNAVESLNNSDVYDMPTDYEGVNAGYSSGQVVSSEVGVPSPIANQGYDDYELWQEYLCKATELIRRAAIVMTEELLRIFDVPVILVGLVAATLGAVAAILAGLALPLIVLAPAVVGSLAHALLTSGQAGVEAVRDYLSDFTGELWGEIACIVSTSITAQVAQERIHAYFSTNAPLAALPILYLYPWESWVNQIMTGMSADGVTVLDVTGIPTLCDGCDDVEGSFKGTGISSCTFDHWSYLSGPASYYESGSWCDGRTHPLPPTFTDGYGGTHANPVNCQSPPFMVDTTGDYEFYYRARSFFGSAAVAVTITGNDTVIWSADLPTGTDAGELLGVLIPVPLDSTITYRMRVQVGNKAFECYDDSLVFVA